MAALQLRGLWMPSPSGIPPQCSEARLLMGATRLRSCPPSSSSTRLSDLILKRHACPIGSARPLRWSLMKNRVSASLFSNAVIATCAEAVQGVVTPVITVAPLLISRVGSIVQELPVVAQLSAASFGLIVFALWGLDPPVQFIWESTMKADCDWEKCQTRTFVRGYVRPVILWAGIIMMCRALDSVVLPSEGSTAIKLRLTHFVRSLTTVTVFALCTGSLIQQVQRHLMKRSNLKDSRSVSLPFIGNAVSTSVWVAAVCLFLESLGFSTHRWLAAGGFGTVLLTLAGREIFTNFLSSVMIHATKPFVETEWIQTKVEGQEVIGTVEHVGWWSPTVIRGDDREAVLIPNHKFSVSVVRNLTQKTHWRVKTHIAINHHDVKKISRIVADMRKVIANHPEIEQRRLHRRVFFDYVNNKNLALMIMVSCFVKTAHFEKYLRVKEGLLLDLLKVVAHHGGRLATPIRSMQRHVEETETEPRPVSYRESQRQAILLTAVSSKSDQKSSASSEQKVYQRKSFKESTSNVETVTATVSSDTKDQGDALPKVKAVKKMDATTTYAAVVENDDEFDVVKEPDNRRLECRSVRDV